MDIATIIMLVLFSFVVGGGLYIIFKLKFAYRKVSDMLGEDLVENLKKAKSLEDHPRSVSGMTRVLLPKILEDFPEFNWIEFKHDIEEKIRQCVKKEHSCTATIHQTEILEYVKNKGTVAIHTQSAVRRGDEETRYNASLLYIQDAAYADSNNTIVVNCANCGAPIRTFGRKHCEYCGSAVTEINIKVWNIENVREVG